MSSYRTGPMARFHQAETARKTNLAFLRIMHEVFTDREYVTLSNTVDHGMIEGSN